MIDVKEPTPEDCSAHKVTDHPDGWRTIAIWYPQMGGYVGKALVVAQPGPDGDSCFDVYVWHDGSFPFDEDGGRARAHLHHCSAGQFIDFGETVQRLLTATEDRG
jgi:hypothetical protein